ncbi:class I tRNA ligase family protein, partial [Intrasporangium sp.]|uniref:class I tRNA ligase family protein n=1 Tax=Intrasporangium sp. TaxID=1925024 RepID=UPI00293A6B58
IRDGVRQVMIPLWNAWSFFALYANTARGGEGYAAQRRTDSTDVLDRYLMAKLREFVETMQDQLDRYEIAAACDTMRTFVDVLTNWYIRRSRDRFWGGESEESLAAFDTLWTALETVTRAVAPLLPLMTEEIWRGLTGERSVHLTDYPAADEFPADHALVVAMDRARDVCSVGSSLRKAKGLRARLPLSSLSVVVPEAASLEPFRGIIMDELNVKDLDLVDLTTASEADYGVEQRLTVNARAAGPRLGRDVQAAIKGSKTGDWSVSPDGAVTSGGLELVEGEYSIEAVVTEPGDGASAGATAMLPGGGFIMLDTDVTPELATEGVARDLVRAVQQARRDAGLHVSDRISLTIQGSPEVFEATVTHRDLLVAETLATQFSSAGPDHQLADGVGTEVSVGEGYKATVLVAKA